MRFIRGMLLSLSLALLPVLALADIQIAASCPAAYLAGVSAGATDVSLFIMPQRGYMEDYNLSETDWMRAQDADAVLLIGGGLESFAEVLYAEGAAPAIAAGENVGRIAGRVLDPDEDDTPADNPYIWLSPTRWGELVHGVSAALVQIDPDSAAIYTAANDAAQAAAQRVQSALSAAMAPYAGREVIVFHPAISYLAADAGLSAVLTIERDPSLDLYSGDIEEIAALAQTYPDAAILAEDTADAALLQVGTAPVAQINVVDARVLGGGSSAWESLMMANIAALEHALAAK